MKTIKAQSSRDIWKEINSPEHIEKEEKKAMMINKFFREYPNEAKLLQETIKKIYEDGNCWEIWHVLAIISGNERGFGNHYYYGFLDKRTRIYGT